MPDFPGNGVPYHVDRGDGEPLMLLHSGGMAHQEWNVHRDAWEQRFRVVTPDLPGHGRTPLVGEELTVAGMVEAVVALLDELGVEAAHVVGSSMGGSVALKLALEHPDRVRRLVLFRIGYRREGAKVQQALALDDPEHWEQRGMATWLSRIHEPQGGPEAWKQVIHRAATLPQRDPAGRDLTTAALEGIDAPTLLVVGDRDPLVPVEEALEMYRAIPRSDLWILPHASHVVASRTWRKAAFEQEIDRFLRAAGRRG